MHSETYLDFCFIRPKAGEFKVEVDKMLSELFSAVNLNWYLEEKTEDGAEIVIVEVKGMSNWNSEDETIEFIEDHAPEKFWQYLQGYKMFVYPAKRGCKSGGSCSH